jgi:hypothetical protein
VAPGKKAGYVCVVNRKRDILSKTNQYPNETDPISKLNDPYECLILKDSILDPGTDQQ